MSAELFAAKVRELCSVREINRLYWRDTASTIKAYTLSSTWRILDLVGQACVLLNYEGVLGPAILARSLIELTTVFVQTGGAVREVVAGAARAWNDTVTASEDLEGLLGKALHGTRTVHPKGISTGRPTSSRIFRSCRRWLDLRTSLSITSAFARSLIPTPSAMLVSGLTVECRNRTERYCGVAGRES